VVLLSLVLKVCVYNRINQLSYYFFLRKDRAMVDDFMMHRPHTIDGRQTEPKRAMPREEASKPEGQLTVKKIFIGGVKEDLTEDDLK
jgi:heterogeneous nuclear ribonucleoprotein A1/A3